MPFAARLVLASLLALPLSAETWHSRGPLGGDVRSLGADPNDSRRIYLGTSDGHIFGSEDAGEHWHILGRAGPRLDAVVTTILVDPRDSHTLYASTWTQDPAAGGGVYRSRDGGQSWQAMGLTGKAVRALVEATPDLDLFIAGTLDGVYRTRDAGKNWERISPEGDQEIRNLDSLAMDPQNPDIIYAGTFHLPWKTTDGGQHWSSIHEGMIDDSDVMSILVDGTNPQRLYASACSGIYRSENRGRLWKKIEGIPFRARRTHVIRQDPTQPTTLYAATTEGLWKTTTAGVSWVRVTPRDWVITSLVLPAESPGRLVMGTERLGVLVSEDGGEHFRSSNDGFFHRQIMALALDRERPGRVLAVVANAPQPVLATEDGGRSWAPLGSGLRGQGLRGVYASPNGWWLALGEGGLMRYDQQQAAWVRAGTVVGRAVRRPRSTVLRLRGSVALKRPLDHLVNDMAFSREVWFAATERGLLASRDHGATWAIFPIGPLTTLPVRSVRVSQDGERIWAVFPGGLVFSRDAGRTLSWHDLPLRAGGALRLDIPPDRTDGQTLVASARNGLYISRDGGESWQQAANGLPDAPIRALGFAGPVFLASMETGGLFISYDRGSTWARIAGTFAEGYFTAITTCEAGSEVFAASATEGLYAVDLTSVSVPPTTSRQAP